MSTSFDFGQKIKAFNMVKSQAWDGDADITSSAFPLEGGEGAAVVVNTGTVSSGANITLAFHEGDESTFTPGTANLLDSGRVISAPTIDDTDDQAYVFSVKANAPYLKVVVSRDGSDSAEIGVTGVLGYIDEVPEQ